VREQTIAALSDCFAEGEIDIEEFERRVTLAHRADSPDDLAALMADLTVAKSSHAVAAPAPVQDAPEQSDITAIFGGTRRDGSWTLARRLRVSAVFGGVVIDLRQARLPAGTLEMHVNATFGGVQIIVPPTLAVEVNGSAIFGGFDHLDRAPTAEDPSRPVLRIHGRAIFGGVSVETRLPKAARLEAGKATGPRQLRNHRRE
jgi:hypothetical protein